MSVTSSLEPMRSFDAVFAPTYLTVGPAFAARFNMPWEQRNKSDPANAVEGPVARKLLAVIIIIVTGPIAGGVGDTSGGFRRCPQSKIVCGLSIELPASRLLCRFLVRAGSGDLMDAQNPRASSRRCIAR